MRRGSVLSVVMGRHREALADLRGALRGARAGDGDRIWEARTLAAMSLVHLDVGEVEPGGAGSWRGGAIFGLGGQAARSRADHARPRVPSPSPAAT